MSMGGWPHGYPRLVHDKRQLRAAAAKGTNEGNSGLRGTPEPVVFPFSLWMFIERQLKGGKAKNWRDAGKDSFCMKCHEMQGVTPPP